MTPRKAALIPLYFPGYMVNIVLTTSIGYTIEDAIIPANPPAIRRSAGFNVMSASSGNPILLFLYATRRSLKDSKAKNCTPLVGATLRQFAPFPLKNPFRPSTRKSSTNSPIIFLFPPRTICAVAITSNGDTAVRETIPATAPARRNFVLSASRQNSRVAVTTELRNANHEPTTPTILSDSDAEEDRIASGAADAVDPPRDIIH
mmetsp:Transcript_15381/g.18231  ORF Transcript_15381/g.18231 Transcript_15381/m.18231 type:complete len:204 (+) Transcript_15381:460-1071(+)